MWLSPAQAVTLTSGPSFLSAVCASRLNLTQNQSVKGNRKEEVLLRGERNGFGQELREAGTAQGSRARAVAAPVENALRL